MHQQNMLNDFFSYIHAMPRNIETLQRNAGVNNNAT